MLKAALRLFKLGLPLALLAYFVWRFVDPEAVLSLVAKTGLVPVIAFLGTLLAARWVQALQTRNAMREAGLTVGAAEIFRAQLVATFYTMFVPGDLVGGGVTWYLLKRSRGGGAAIATVLVYLRLVFLVTAIPFVIFGLIAETRLHSTALFLALFTASVATVAVTLPLVLRSAARVSGDLIAVISSRFGEGKGRFQRALATLRECITTCAAASASATWTVFSFAIALHILGAIGLWLAAEAAHANVPLHAFLWVWPLMIVVHMLPLSFGGLGVREITLIYVLSTLYSTSAESVLLLSMIALFATTLFSLAGGIWNLFGAAGSGKDSA